MKQKNSRNLPLLWLWWAALARTIGTNSVAFSVYSWSTLFQRQRQFHLNCDAVAHISWAYWNDLRILLPNNSEMLFVPSRTVSIVSWSWPCHLVLILISLFPPACDRLGCANLQFAIQTKEKFSGYLSECLAWVLKLPASLTILSVWPSNDRSCPLP